MLLVFFLIQTLQSSPGGLGQSKLFIFLNEPLREKSVVIQMDNQKRIVDLKEEITALPTAPVPHKMIYNQGKNARRSIVLILSAPGLLKLEVFDFYGKQLCTIYNGPVSQGRLVLEETPAWKAFTNFRGIVLFNVSLNGQVVLRKLLSKIN
jgi:hypothetical protein